MVERGGGWGLVGLRGVGSESSGNCRSAAVSSIQLNDKHSGTSKGVFMIASERKSNASVCFRPIYSGPSSSRVSFFSFFFLLAVLMGGKIKAEQS